jgi:DNA-binding protein H-NS
MPFNQTGRISRAIDAVAGKPFRLADYFSGLLGYSLAELVGTETRASRAPTAAKYRHPENPALTWSGRGRKPQWFVDALEAGKTAGELAVG